MNLILFEPGETTVPLSRRDPRALHLLKVLRREVGGTFDAGRVNGPRGKGTLVEIGTRELILSFVWGPEPPPLDPVTLIVGLPRPQTARKILQEATAIGVAALHFVATEKSDPNYAESALWHTDEWRRQVLNGAEQAFCTRIPLVSYHRTFSEIFSELPGDDVRIALDNYESATPLSRAACAGPHLTIAVGPERGWSAVERDALRAHNFLFVHLGPRVLRVETACVAALTLAKARAGFL